MPIMFLNEKSIVLSYFLYLVTINDQLSNNCFLGRLHVDINKLPEFDILTEGFPCQAFSIAGYRKGFDEDKVGGNLFFRFAKKLNIESSVITHALKKLENEGLIHAYREKKLKYYEINDKNTINTIFLNLDKLNNKRG